MQEQKKEDDPNLPLDRRPPPPPYSPVCWSGPIKSSFFPTEAAITAERERILNWPSSIKPAQ